MLFCTIAALVAGCTDDNFPRYLTEKELKKVRVEGGHTDLDSNRMTGRVLLRIRNDNKKFDVYGIHVKCSDKDKKPWENVLLTGRVSSGISELLEGYATYAGMIKHCSVMAAKAGI